MESLVFLVLLFLVGGVLQSLAQRKQQRRRQEGLPRRVGADLDAKPEDLFEALKKAYRQAEQDQLAARPRTGFPQRDQSLEEMVEETESLEVEPEVGTLERITTRPERVTVDQDEGAEAVLATRLKWADDHSKPISPTDHRRFDQAIRAPRPAALVAADPAAARLAELRRMLVWREVLGPPKSMQ